MTKIHVKTNINGDKVEFLADPRETLLDCLRDHIGLTGSKEGCGTGDCGACSCIFDGDLVSSCLVLGVEAEGKSIETIEGMAGEKELHPLQKKFIEMAALQCGFCTPGILIAAKALLDRIMTLPRVKFDTGWLEIFVDVLDTIKLLRLLWKQPKIFGRQRDG